ncbi:G2/M phase-specific E3 ubiquitin-protein ligase [Labeo rohita]|uniref:G2/M phase-specific E3 ubiquitin-protein ligase n=1 Tax=Labeo rohita TaxID=84645 RepID=A0ABQ8LAP9_LABRO|nr:G2/M phase-specific E3 ubiquitin-protein ligase [Labeo rohita]
MKYRELKETERKTFSKSKKKSNKPVKISLIFVEISVGIMNKTKNGLNPMRGKNLPLHVDPQWSSEQLLAAALKKQKDFTQDMEDREYGSQIKNIPATDTPFTMGEYKEAIGKAYHTLWSSPESSTPERRHRSATTSVPSASQSSNGQCIYPYLCPITIDSSSSDLEEVEKLPEKDSDGHDLTLTERIGFRRSSFNPTCSMMVKFTDDAGLTEEALDSGGPTREFLTLLMDSIKTRIVFESKDNAKYLSFDSKEDNEYFHIGRMIAVSIVHGGPGPCCLSPNFFLYLIGKVKTLEAPIEDIPDDEAKRGLLENPPIKNATSLSKLQELREKYSSMLQTAGCYRFMKTLEDKKKVVDDYIQWYFIYQNHVSIQRFKEGLATLDFVNALEQHPSLFSFMYYTETKLTADAVENIFHVQFSQPGSTNRQEEARVLSYWRDYLLYLEEKEASPSLEDVLMFGTGLKEVPPAAIQPQPQLVFRRVHAFPWQIMTRRLMNRSDGVVIPKFSVLIKVFLQDAQEDITQKALMLVAAVEKVPLSQVTEQINPELSPNDGMAQEDVVPCFEKIKDYVIRVAL